MTTFTVDSTADSDDGTCDLSDCTLREAINAANASAGFDTIIFDTTVFPPASPSTITLNSSLPAIAAGNITVDGSSARVVVDGVSNTFDCIVIESSSNSVKGLEIYRCDTGVVLVSGPANANVIGGTAETERNVISANNIGLEIVNSATGGNVVLGNYIGTDATGTAALGNSRDGVAIIAPNNIIGGSEPGAGNVISGNGQSGVVIGSYATGNTLQGNYIGTDKDGTADLGNSWEGVRIYERGNVIGGTATAARNVISGNDGSGVYIGASGNHVQGNYIGTDKNGTGDLGNSVDGVYVGEAPDNTVGGTEAGAGNVISGNDQHGVHITGADATGNVVQGNLIGTDVDGMTAQGNDWDGVHLHNAPGNTIGGTAPGARNIISGNGYYGIEIHGSGPPGNQVQGNFIGINANGTAALGNGLGGVVISGGSSNTIGGTEPGARNVISGNSYDNIHISLATENKVQGNFIGTDASGTASFGIGGNGIVVGWAPNNTIGGASAAARNVVSGGFIGVMILGGVSGNRVQGNFVGTDVTGTVPLGNSGSGVWVRVDATDTIVGGLAVEERNIIAYNGLDGVRVSEAASGNSIHRNSIHSNAGKGINNDGGNMELAPPIIDAAGNQVSGHTNPKCYPCTVEVFSDSEDEGRTYLGSTTTNDDATGTWTHSGWVVGPNVTATATDADGNTSEFSAPVPYSPPVGGVAEVPNMADMPGGIAGPSAERSTQSIQSTGMYAALACAAGGAIILGASAWYTTRRRRARD